jgi:hypothetical protein
VVKHVDAVELRVVVAAVHAVDADAVLVAQLLLKLGAHLVTALARLHVRNLTRKSSLEAGGKREKKGEGERGSVRNSMLQFGTGNRKCRWRARACIPNGKTKWFYHSKLSSFGTVQSTLSVGGCGRKIFASATYQQLAKASAAMLSQQEKTDTVYVQRGRVNIPGFIGTVVS